MKHLYPSLGIGMRKIINKRFDMVLIDEFRTSKLCCQCHQELEKHNGKHRLLKCLHCKANESHNEHKSPQDKIYMFVNRDLNACKRSNLW